MTWLEIVIPLLCAVVTSPIVIHLIQKIRIVRELQLEDEVERWVKIACSYVERWAANQQKASPAAKPTSAEKLGRARDLVRARVKAQVTDEELTARIEHELAAREKAKAAAVASTNGVAASAVVEKAS